MQTVQFVAALALLVAVAHAYPTLVHYSGHNDYSGHNELSHGGHGLSEKNIDYYAHPEYKFDYAVHSPHSGDVKNQWETRNGDVVKGSYSVVEADGSVRTVKYSADKHNGFQAIVSQGGKVSTHGYGDEKSSGQGSGHSVTVNHGISHGISHGLGQSIGHHGYGY